MNFTSNHDENSWNGTEFERMGDAARQFAALTFAEPGMPLIYSGQEVGNDNSLGATPSSGRTAGAIRSSIRSL